MCVWVCEWLQLWQQTTGSQPRQWRTVKWALLCECVRSCVDVLMCLRHWVLPAVHWRQEFYISSLSEGFSFELELCPASIHKGTLRHGHNKPRYTIQNQFYYLNNLTPIFSYLPFAVQKNPSSAERAEVWQKGFNF